jgi:hypothetical protein
MVEVPNSELRSLLAEARWSGSTLAREVNRLGDENRLRLGYERSSVSRWLCGTRPRDPVPVLIAEALGRKLGRTVTLAAIGFGDHDVEVIGLRDPVAELAGLAASGTDVVYRRDEMAVPAWTDASAALCAVTGDTGSGGRLLPQVGPAELAAVSSMITLSADANAALGAASVRPAVSRYLATPAADWLYASTGTAAQPAFYAAMARLTCLAGDLCMDDELHGAAQRYYRTALALAVRAGDPTSYAIGTQRLSGQARELGHRRAALRLAETAVAVPAVEPPQVRALLHSEHAVAHAANGDREQTSDQFAVAEKHLRRDPGTPVAVGGYHYGHHAYQQAMAHALLGDPAEAIQLLSVSVQRRPLTERPTRAMTLARMAELHLDCGHIDWAIESWHRFLDEYPAIDCGRARHALDDLRARLQPYGASPRARGLLHRASLLRSRGGPQRQPSGIPAERRPAR